MAYFIYLGGGVGGSDQGGAVGGTCGKFFGRDSASPLPVASLPGQGFKAPTSLFQVKQHKHQQYQYQVHYQHQNKNLALF